MNGKTFGNTNTIVASTQTLLGAFLFVAPWLLGFSSEYAASWTAWITGLFIFVLGVFSFADENETWPAWVNFIFRGLVDDGGMARSFPVGSGCALDASRRRRMVAAASIWKLYVGQMKPHVTA